jgi:ATP-dependent RNA circularization protein (DNA/RNA ligase family)
MSKGYVTTTEAIIKGFERLVENEHNTNTRENAQELNSGLVASLQERIESLEEQMKVKDGSYHERIEDLKEQLKIKDSQQDARINDLLDQLKVKDQQLEKKDTHIENLTNTMQSQAINIHDIINQKAIEAPGAKKWWKFW